MNLNLPTLDYEEMVEYALLDVVRNTLRYVEKYGLPGGHHFYITLKTHHPGVKLPDFLIRKHEDTITIVLQYEFTNLHVTDKEFGVTLSFNNRNYYVRVPFEAITVFADPSVKFSLQFRIPETRDFSESEYEKAPELAFTEEDEKIVSLDEFRKK